MTGNNSLRPEVRVNKNGVAVTKHVRNEVAASKDTSAAFPPPSTAPLPKVVTRETIKELDSLGLKLQGSSWGNKNIFHLAKNHPELLSTLVNRVRSSSTVDKGIWNYVLGDVMQFPTRNSTVDSAPETYRKWLAMLPLGPVLFQNESTTFPSALIYRISSLMDAIKTSLGSDYDADADDYRSVKAVMTVIQVDKAAGGTGRIAERAEDIAFIRNNLGAVESSLDLIWERKSTDKEVVQQIIESASPSLSNGLL